MLNDIIKKFREEGAHAAKRLAGVLLKQLKNGGSAAVGAHLAGSGSAVLFTLLGAVQNMAGADEAELRAAVRDVRLCITTEEHRVFKQFQSNPEPVSSSEFPRTPREHLLKLQPSCGKGIEGELWVSTLLADAMASRINGRSCGEK